jgi:hypothetical protein
MMSGGSEIDKNFEKGIVSSIRMSGENAGISVGHYISGGAPINVGGRHHNSTEDANHQMLTTPKQKPISSEMARKLNGIVKSDSKQIQKSN